MSPVAEEQTITDVVCGHDTGREIKILDRRTDGRSSLEENDARVRRALCGKHDEVSVVGHEHSIQSLSDSELFFVVDGLASMSRLESRQSIYASDTKLSGDGNADIHIEVISQ